MLPLGGRMRDTAKPLLKGRFKVYVCPHVRFDCYSFNASVVNGLRRFNPQTKVCQTASPSGSQSHVL